MYLIIMQGPPGSGKITLARKIVIGLDGDCIRCSTDDLRIVDGVYVFVASESADKHAKNQERVRSHLQNGTSVIVDNTNIKAWEARPYVEMGVLYGADIIFIRCEGKYQNNHGVPDEQVQRMREGMEELSIKKCLKAERPTFSS